MAIKLVDGRFACSICNKIYPQASKADDCRLSHNVIYVPLTHTELNRLIIFMNMGDPSVLPDGLYEKLTGFARAAARQK